MAPSRLSRRPLTEERRESESNVVLIIRLDEWACADEGGGEGEGTTDEKRGVGGEGLMSEKIQIQCNYM